MSSTRFTFLNFSKESLGLIEGKPPAASALQSFETFLLLSALGRHPQALITLASSLESAHKSLCKLSETEHSTLAEALGGLNGLVSPDSGLPLAYPLKNFREARNRIAHFGHSPSDDAEAIKLAFGSGIPLFSAWTSTELEADIFGCLGGGLGSILRTACDLVRPSSQAQITPRDAVRGVKRWIVHHIRESFLADWEVAVLDGDTSSLGTDPVSGYDFRLERLSALQRRDPYATISCPVCGEHDSFVVTLDEGALFGSEPALLAVDGTCVYCDFHAPSSTSGLLGRLCARQFDASLLAATRKAYGES